MKTRAWLMLAGIGLLTLGQARPAWAGAWTVPRHHAYLEYFYRYFGSKDEFGSDGDRHRRATHGSYRDVRNEWKFEYGLTDWWNLLGSVPYIKARYRDDNNNLPRSGVGDMYLRTKLRLLNHPVGAHGEPLVGSVQVSWKMPYAYNVNKNPIGKGQYDVETRLLVSRAWLYWPQQAHAAAHRPAAPALSDRREAAMEHVVREREAVIEHTMAERDARHAAPTMDQTTTPEEEVRYAGVAFVNLEGGFTARNEAPANDFPFLMEAGFTPLKRLMLVGSFEGVVSERMTHEQIENYVKWGVRAIVNLWGDGFASIFHAGQPTVNFELGYDNIFAGVNTAQAFEVFTKLGVSF